MRFVTKVGGSGEADVDVKTAENESSEDDDVKNPKFSDFNVETESISEEERKQNK